MAASLLGVALASDPATVLALTLHRVSLAVFEFELVSDPLGGHVPALVVWGSSASDCTSSSGTTARRPGRSCRRWTGRATRGRRGPAAAVGGGDGDRAAEP
ncbi:hypothetical protein ACFQRB_11440 [Halobaculum litoreum]|uniref:Uncharacterized protein n=1 Tax=Halobaculum litoreum TaxID=3031998 RepID=A0ABD5XP32_9EURY